MYQKQPRIPQQNRSNNSVLITIIICAPVIVLFILGFLLVNGFSWYSPRYDEIFPSSLSSVDVAVANSDYWLWKNPGASETKKIAYANKIPKKLVEIFERHGFVWGGAWYHYDTMHFEYRPEILAFAKYS